MMSDPRALLLAVGLDLALGELPDRWHPVAWIGRLLARAEAAARHRSVVDGAVALVAVTTVVGAAAAVVGALVRRAGRAGVLLEAAALKPAFAVRRLAAAAREVGQPLRAGRLDVAREQASRHLVSRATGGLDAGLVASAAVESVAENLTDSVAAPLLAYAVAGLPGAWAYRVINTADAMWGYRDARYEAFGKAAARLDDVANLLPARLAALALGGGAVVAGADAGQALRIAWRDHARTASPNAGWPMAAMAGALGVALVKPGAYRLGDGVLPDGAVAIDRAVRVFAGAAALVVAGALAVAVWRRGP
jgi:adenosylcobinamide-phosphate synthase